MKTEKNCQKELIPAMKRMADKITKVYFGLDSLCKDKEIVVEDGVVTVRFKDES